MAESLAIYMAGSCAQLIDDSRAPYACVIPDVELLSARVAMTGTIATEVLQGAPADVVLSANRAYMDQLREAGLIPNPIRFARNRLAILVSPGSVGKVRSPGDLTRDDVTTMVMPPHEDPCGAYTVGLFERIGLTQAMCEQKSAGRLIVLDPSSPKAFSNDAIDARILYRSIGSRFPDATIVELPPPYDMSDRIEFVAGAVERNGTIHPGAEAFIEMLTGPTGKAVLTQHNFLPAADD